MGKEGEGDGGWEDRVGGGSAGWAPLEGLHPLCEVTASTEPGTTGSLSNTIAMFIANTCFDLLWSSFLPTRLEVTHRPFSILSKTQLSVCFMSIWTKKLNLERTSEECGERGQNTVCWLLLPGQRLVTPEEKCGAKFLYNNRVPIKQYMHMCLSLL